MELKKTSQIQCESFKCLIYGPSGSGKTFTASTFKEPPLVISAEPGLLTLKNFDLDYILLDQNRLIDHFRDILKKILSNELNYKTIFLDGLGDFSDAFLLEAEKKYPDISHTKLKFGEHKTRFKKFLKALRDLKRNLIITALLQEKEKGGSKNYYPNIAGSLAHEIPAMMDFVFYIYKEEQTDKRLFLTRPTGGHICKARSGELKMTEDANFQKIFDKIFS